MLFSDIRQLRLVRRSITFHAAHSLVLALIHSRLDYCNGILANAPSSLINSLQSVQRSAARLALRLPSRASVTKPMLNHLHWLPVQQRVLYKLGVQAYKCIHQQAPIYLARMCINVATNPVLATHRSAAQGRLVVPAANMKTVGHRGFYYACPTSWNTPPFLITDPSLTLSAFRRLLKTFLFTKLHVLY